MEEYIARLIDMLAEQRDVYVKLTAGSERKREAIVNNSVEALDAEVKEEQLLLARLQELERNRKTLLSSVAVVAGRPASELNVGIILESCPAHLQAPLIKVQKELTAQLHEQAKINDINKKLLESRIEYMRFLTEAGGGGQGNSYDTTGGDARKQTQGSRLIDLGV